MKSKAAILKMASNGEFTIIHRQNRNGCSSDHLQHIYTTQRGYGDIICANIQTSKVICAKIAFSMAAILDLHNKALAYVVKTIFIGFLDLENICLDTKIISL